MSLNFESNYTLTDLLLFAGRGFASKELRQIVIKFDSSLSYCLECTDAKTNRLRYSHSDSDRRTVLTYYEQDKLDQALRDFYNDIRNYSDRLVVNRTATTIVPMAELYLSGVMKPVVYRGSPSGYGYRKV